jgi:hypothetical protein
MTERPGSFGMLLREVARPAVLRVQRTFRLFPQEICLISGAPRSGTTALIDWLGHQPGVAAFEESRILVGIHRFIEDVYRFNKLERDSERLVNLARHLVLDYYSSCRVLIGKRILLDKEPLEPVAFPSREYGRFLVHVRRLFPESKILLAVRDPLATVWSMSERTWGESLTNGGTKQFTIEEYAQNWCACADLVLRYRSDPRTYVVQFGRLMNDPGDESRRILDFLNVRHGEIFEPRQTRDIGFSKEQRETILGVVQPQLDLLNGQGISALK